MALDIQQRITYCHFIDTALSQPGRKKQMQMIRTITAAAMVPAMKVTGFRFSKEYRWAETGWRRAVYLCVDTVGANIKAGL